MVKFENECVGCHSELGCIGNSCSYKHVPHFYCDDCKEEEELFEYDGLQLCRECIYERVDESLVKVEAGDWSE